MHPKVLRLDSMPMLMRQGSAQPAERVHVAGATNGGSIEGN